LVSNVEDLARFLIEHLAGSGAVLRPSTLADMHRLHAPLGSGGGGTGLGFRVDQRGRRPFFCHVGDGGGFTTFVGGHPDERVGVVLLMNVGGAETERAAITNAALEWLLDDAPPRAARAGTALRPPPRRYRSTYWGLGAQVTEPAGVPTLTIGGTNVSRLTEAGGRWRAEGGMFDGRELDFDVTSDGRRFCARALPVRVPRRRDAGRHPTEGGRRVRRSHGCVGRNDRQPRRPDPDPDRRRKRRRHGRAHGHGRD
jgi:hypothetical protein